MAKGINYLSSWIEVAPALLISPLRTSNSPVLETITEEEAEESDDDDYAKRNYVMNCNFVVRTYQ